jgi:uncharacterized membrane protein YjjB (DUF3815 family)
MLSIAALKSFRDGGIAGGVTAVTTIWLMQNGSSPDQAAIIGAIAGGFASRLYRLLRSHWKWLQEFDPPAEGGS